MFIIFIVICSIPNLWKPCVFRQGVFSSLGDNLSPLAFRSLGLLNKNSGDTAGVEWWLNSVVSVSRLGSMLVTVQVLFSSNVDPSVVKKVFLDKTLNISSHWLGATYQLTDLHVTGARLGVDFMAWRDGVMRKEGRGFSGAVEWMEALEGKGGLSGGPCWWPMTLDHPAESRKKTCSNCTQGNDYFYS